MTIFKILQVFHASLCPLGHGCYIEFGKMPLLIIYISAGMLLLGAAPLPYGYYTLLRIVGAGIFTWSAIINYKKGNQSLLWASGLLALLFNPFMKIHLTKELWVFIDIGAGIFLLSIRGIIKQDSSR